jgi:hypothetical protein
MQARFPTFRLNRNAVFYMGLASPSWRSSCWPPSTLSPPKAPAARCRMKAG